MADLRRVPRIVLIVMAALVGTWFSVALTASGVSPVVPGASRLAWPFDVEPEMNSAAQIMQRAPTRANVAQAARLAESAVRRNALNVTAVTILGLSADVRRDRPGALRRFRYAEFLSRRDLPTQLWLIEERVAANDVGGALLHYDRALRTSSRAEEILFPVLVQAANERAIADRLAELLAARPLWWAGLGWQMVASSQSPYALFRMGRALRLDPAIERERGILAGIVRRLVTAEQFEQAYSLYSAARPDVPGGAGPRNGSFEADDVLPPFDWELATESDLAAIIQPNEAQGEGRALALIADNGRSGEVARQLLLLRPGRHRIAARIGSVPARSFDVRVSLVCASSASQSLALVTLPDTGAGGAAWQMSFTVPANCRAQWLAISLGSGDEVPDPRPWIDSIAVRPL